MTASAMTSSSSRSRPTVAILDDEPVALRVVGRLLERAELHPLIAQRADELLALVGAYRPRLILLDVNMPGVDLRSLVQAVRERAAPQTTAVILRSAHDENTLATLAATYGADGYVVKTARFTELERKVLGWLGITRTRSSLLPAVSVTGSTR